MDYIVSAEDTPYYHWQLELLIQSFKRHGLEDNLLIALANRDVPRTPDFARLLSKHKRIMNHENMGRKRGYAYLNKPYAVTTALGKGELKAPFTVIEPDMLLYRPVQPENEPISFQIKEHFSLGKVEEHVNIKKHIKDATFGKSDSLWLPVGSVYSFGDVPHDMFSRIVSWAEVLAFESFKKESEKKKTVEYWKYLERAGWALGFLNYIGFTPYKGTHTYEMSLLDHNVHHNFIHYTNGMPPMFSKHMFKYEPPDYISGGITPFNAMLQETPTTASLYMHQVVQSYIAG
jgi:hypothetical protein